MIYLGNLVQEFNKRKRLEKIEEYKDNIKSLVRFEYEFE